MKKTFDNRLAGRYNVEPSSKPAPLTPAELEKIETVERAKMTLPTLYAHLFAYYGEEVAAETAFRAETKRRGISQFATEKALNELSVVAEEANAAVLKTWTIEEIEHDNSAQITFVVPDVLM